MPQDDDDAPKLHYAKVDDEFLKHPCTGASIRNPLLDKGQKGKPIVWAKDDFEHNHLGDAMKEWKEIRITEANFTQIMTGRNGRASPDDLKLLRAKRAPLGKLNDMDVGFDFTIQLDKVEYQEDKRRRGRRRDQPKLGIQIEKLGIEVKEGDGGKVIIVEGIGEGLISVWNKAYPGFAIYQGDQILRVNEVSKSALDMIEECKNSDGPCMVIKRIPGNRPKVEEGAEDMAAPPMSPDRRQTTNQAKRASVV